ncbi:coenzyme A transferase [Ferroglobus placidus DSM 10642]|uniref:Coenzyme A transferase n=1 Tax=Ferroglobus placidus (strain DSM 10642 / AEDII12DO) TaxID=589924 RepID=D3RXV9_FERPA|nr:CoA-transferase [Ferroglobus placidus]ADC65322.1 coenzyme A transferase [Ferroglobus placidus DSM 10642]
MSFTTLDKANYMISAMARLLKDAESAFMGVASFLPFMAIVIAKKLYNPDLIWYSIVGYNPNPKHLPMSTVHPWISKYCDAKLQLAELFDISARGELDVVFLAGAQIDQRGYLNNSHVYINGKRIQFPGGAGGALLHATARRPIVWQGKHDRRIFVKEVQRITAAGKPYRVVSPLCIFKFDEKAGKLVVDTIHPWSSYKEIKEKTEFEVNDAPTTPPPTEEEIELMNRIDPHGIRKIVLE